MRFVNMSFVVSLRQFSKSLKCFQSCDRFFGTFSLGLARNSHTLCRNVTNRKLSLPLMLKVRNISISIYETPNPNSIKFHLNQVILNDDTLPHDFPSEESATICSLASLLHKVSGIKGVYVGQDFVTISRVDGADWADIKTNIDAILMEYFLQNKFVQISGNPQTGEADTNNLNGNKEDDVVIMIKELIDSKIRPTVQEDGGDIIYMGFEKGVVKVKLQGSCSGCPSSEVTLKMGVQNMLKFYVPEVIEVMQVQDEKDHLSEQLFKDFEDTLKDKT